MQPLIIILLIFFSQIIKAKDFKADINHDKIDDIIYYPNEKGELKISISNKNGYNNSTVDLKYYYSDMDLNFPNFQSFHVNYKDGILKFEIKLAPKFLDGRIFILTCKGSDLLITSFFDVSINTMDQDIPKDTCYYKFSEPIKLVTLNIPIEKLKGNKDCKHSFKNVLSLESYLEEVRSGHIGEKPLERMKSYMANYPLSVKNLSTYNDIGYYLEKGKSYKESVFILEEVIEKFPDRTVAYINLGDAYFGLKNSPKAKEAYNKYIVQMKKSGKEAKIPKKVYERLK